MAKAKAIFNRMARMNGSKLAETNWELLPKEYESSSRNSSTLNQSNLVEKKKEVKISPFAMMKDNPRLGVNLVIVVFSWVACSFNYFLLSFYTKYLGGNVFLNNAMIAIAGISGKIVSIIASKFLHSKPNIIS